MIILYIMYTITILSAEHENNYLNISINKRTDVLKYKLEIKKLKYYRTYKLKNTS